MPSRQISTRSLCPTSTTALKLVVICPEPSPSHTVVHQNQKFLEGNLPASHAGIHLRSVIVSPVSCRQRGSTAWCADWYDVRCRPVDRAPRSFHPVPVRHSAPLSRHSSPTGASSAPVAETSTRSTRKTHTEFGEIWKMAKIRVHMLKTSASHEKLASLMGTQGNTKTGRLPGGILYCSMTNEVLPSSKPFQ
jgi:hypothetical protein